MTIDRIEEIQKETAYPQSTSVQTALLKVWNETERDNKAIRQLAYDAIDFLRVLEEDGEFRFWEEGYNTQVLNELKEDAEELL